MQVDAYMTDSFFFLNLCRDAHLDIHIDIKVFSFISIIILLYKVLGMDMEEAHRVRNSTKNTYIALQRNSPILYLKSHASPLSCVRPFCCLARLRLTRLCCLTAHCGGSHCGDWGMRTRMYKSQGKISSGSCGLRGNMQGKCRLAILASKRCR